MAKVKENCILLILFALTTIVFFGCAYRQKINRLLKDNTLLYCYRDSERIYQPLYHIVEMRGDSIYEAGTRCDSLQEWYRLQRNWKGSSGVEVPFQIPYFLKKTGKRIKLLYNAYPSDVERQRTYKKVQYLLRRKDSTICTDLTYLCNQEIGYSKYEGKTTITIANHKLNCFIFKEYYYRSKFGQYSFSRDLTITRYFEKSTLIPIKIDATFYNGTGFKLPESGNWYYEVNSIIPQDSLRKNLTYKTRYCY